MYKSLVFGDEFLAQGLHLQSHPGAPLRILGPLDSIFTRALLPSGGGRGGGGGGVLYGWGYRGISPSVEMAIA